MTIRDDLLVALPPVTADLVIEFGVRCDLRRKAPEPSRSASGVAQLEWYKPAGTLAGVKVIPEQVSAERVRHIWGENVDVDLAGMSGVTPICEGDRLKVREGEYNGDGFEVVGRKPEEVGGIATLALKRLPENVTTETFA